MRYTSVLGGHITMTQPQPSTEVDQLAEHLKGESIDAKNKAFESALKLHRARTYAEACGGRVPPKLDYSFELKDPSLTGDGARYKRDSVPFSAVDPPDKEETLEERIEKYRERYPNWYEEMYTTAARLDFDARPNERNQWQVVRSKKELKKLTKAAQLRNGQPGPSGNRRGKKKNRQRRNRPTSDRVPT